ncbi:MAG: proton-conducting transporter membrane subunit [Alphaproteobacteria bacterium]
MDMVLIPLFLAIALGVALYARAIPQGNGGWWRFAAATVALAVAARMVGHGWAAVLLATSAEFLAVGMVWSGGTAEARAAARKYLTAVLLATLCGWTALALIQLGAVRPAAPWDRLAVALLLISVALKLGLVPVYFWLPAVARASSAMTTALIVAVVDVGAFCELLALRDAAPWLFTDFAPLWIGLAVLSLLGAALLALAQRELKPMLAFSSIDDMGYLLLGLVAGGADCMAGAWFGILGHAMGKIVLFGAVGAAEWHLGRAVTLDDRGLSTPLPVASAAFMLGALGFIGIPPTLGFIGHWRLYLAGAELGGPLLLAVLYASSAMALLCYVRAIHRVWLGPVEAPVAGRPLPPAAALVLLAFAIAPVLLGLAPNGLRPAAEPHPHVAALPIEPAGGVK